LLRVGAVSYLNTRPLIDGLDRLLPDGELTLDVPSQLARDLAAGRLDVALIPAVEYFRGTGYSIIPGISISSFGPVTSVKVLSRVPFADIRSLALDFGSRTSVCLTSIILGNLFGLHPRTEILSMERSHADAETDAVLLIGDRAMRVPDGAYRFTLDLGYEWSRWTGLPFVWAVWAVRPGVTLTPAQLAAFDAAKRSGRSRLREIADREAAGLSLDESLCRYYLERVIRHDLGPEELAGLTRFQRLAEERGLVPAGVSCVFHGQEHPVESR
jgi:chorismate dehydratase